MAEAVDVAKLLEQFHNQSDAQRVATDNLDKQQEKMDVSVAAETTAQREEAGAAAAVQGMVDSLLLERSARNKEAAAAFGTNQEASTSIINSMGAAIRAKHLKLQESGADIQARLSANFADDPLNWLYDRFALPYDVAAYNAEEQSLNRDIETIGKLQGLTEEQVRINNAIDAGTTAEISRAKQKQILAGAEVKVQQAEQQAIKNNVQIGSVRLQATQQQFTNWLQLQRSVIDLEQLKLQKIQIKEMQEDRKLRREALNITLDEKTDKAKYREETQKLLDKATGTLGMRRIDVLEFERMTPQLKAALESAMTDPNIQNGRLGHNTITSLEVANNLNAPLTPQLQDLKSKLVSWTQSVASSDPTWGAKKADQRSAAYETRIKQNVERELANIPDTGGIFSAPPLKAMGQIPAVANTVLWKSVFSTQANNPTAPLKAQAVYDAAIDLVSRGAMPMEQAAREISTIYKSAVSANYTDRDYNRFAIQIPEKFRHKYITSIETAGKDAAWAYSKQRPIDMTNEAQVTNGLMRAIAARRIQSTGIPEVFPR